jgi:type II secretory pathway component GspD/PulD (secretin)
VTGPPKEANGQLTVKALEENHTQIVAILDKLREVRGISVSVEMVLLSVPAGFVDKHGDELGDNLAGLVAGKPQPAKPEGPFAGAMLHDKDVSRLLEVVKKDREAKVISSPRLTARNGQEAIVTVGSEVPYVASIKALTTDQGTTEYQQQTEKLFNGCRLEVQPTVSADRKWVTMKAKATLTDLLAMEKIPFKDAPGDKNLYTQQPRVNVRDLSTTVSIPDGETFLLSGFRQRSGDDGNGEGRQVHDTILLLKPTIVTKKPGEADQGFPLLRPAK